MIVTTPTPSPTPLLVLRPRWASRSPPPAPPSAPILGPLLRATDCAKQPLDRLPHLIVDDVADEGDEVRRSRHASPPCPGWGSLLHNRSPAVHCPLDAPAVLRKERTARREPPEQRCRGAGGHLVAPNVRRGSERERRPSLLGSLHVGLVRAYQKPARKTGRKHLRIRGLKGLREIGQNQ